MDRLRIYREALEGKEVFPAVGGGGVWMGVGDQVQGRQHRSRAYELVLY